MGLITADEAVGLMTADEAVGLMTADEAVGLHNRRIPAQTVRNCLRDAHLRACHPHQGLKVLSECAIGMLTAGMSTRAVARDLNVLYHKLPPT